MKELKIYEYQAKAISEALRMVNNAFKCSGCTTCLDRNVMQSIEMIKNVLAGEPDKFVNYPMPKQISERQMRNG